MGITVPRLSPDPVGTTPLPGVRVPTDVPGATFGSPVMPDLSGFQRQATELVERERQKADTTAMLDADNQLATLQTDLHTQATSLRGKDAMGAAALVADQWKKGVGQIEGTLSTVQQRQAFKQRVGARWGTLYEAVESHAAQQAQGYAEQTAGDALKTRLSHAIEFYQQPGAITQSVDETKAILSDFGRRSGWSSETVQAKTEEAVSRIHVGVIERMLANEQDLSASHYYQGVKDQIAGDDAAKVERALEEGSVRGESQHLADLITAGHTIGDDGQPNVPAAGQASQPTQQQAARLTEQEALVQARKIVDPKVRDATVERISKFYTEQAQAQAQQHKANLDGAANIIEQTRDANKVPPAVWSTFSVGERSSLREYADKLTQGSPVHTDLPTWYDLRRMASNPETQGAFAQLPLTKYITKLSPEDFKTVGEWQAGLLAKDTTKTEALLKGVETHDQIVTQTLRGAGIRVGEAGQPALQKEDAATEYQLRSAIEAQVLELQQQTKKPVTSEQVQTIANQIVTQHVVSTPGAFYGTNTTKKRLDQLGPGDQVALRSSDVPLATRNEIVQQLRAEGYPVTDSNIVKRYTAIRLRGKR